MAEEEGAFGGWGQRVVWLEDADTGSLFDVLAVAHEDDFVEAEGGGWQFDTVGNRTTQTDHNPAGDTTWTYTHPNPGTSQPHTLTSVTATGPLAGTPTRSFTYDTAGNTLTRHTDTGVAQQLAWDAEGRLDTLTEGTDETTYIYDTEGNRLISRAPDKTTLYLGATELTLTTGSNQPDGTRYYSSAERTI
ncbi:hypothetical protein KIF24_09480 [Micromonospora sp. Llam7]|nr:hypothetical protein [Micromonospora tarapacensis]